MSITLITTVGGANSDSYNSVSEFDVFLARRRGSATVLGMEPDDKAAALLEAMDLLEELNWQGARVTTTQALSHPRTGLSKRDTVSSESAYDGGYSLTGPQYYLTTEIAAPVKKAQCELAFLILNSQYNQDEALKAPVQSITMDGLSKTYGAGGRTSAQKGSVPASVGRLLSGLVRGSKLLRA